jgi:hypothetical protein
MKCKAFDQNVREMCRMASYVPMSSMRTADDRPGSHMINRDTHRLIIREDAFGLDAFWLKKGSVKPSDIDCTDNDILASHSLAAVHRASIGCW